MHTFLQFFNESIEDTSKYILVDKESLPIDQLNAVKQVEKHKGFKYLCAIDGLDIKGLDALEKGKKPVACIETPNKKITLVFYDGTQTSANIKPLIDSFIERIALQNKHGTKRGSILHDL